MSAVSPNGKFARTRLATRRIGATRLNPQREYAFPRARFVKRYVVRIAVAMTNRANPAISTEISTSDGNVFEQELSRGEHAPAALR